MENISIPKVKDDYLRDTAATLISREGSCTHILRLCGDGEKGTFFDDGEVQQWQVELDHINAEKLAQNLRKAARHAVRIAQFER